MEPNYEILIYSNNKNSVIVGLASNTSDNLLYLVTLDPEDKEKLKYSPLAIIEDNDKSLVTHYHHGLMSKEDKILFDKLTSYMDKNMDALKFSDEGASITLSKNEVSLISDNTSMSVTKDKSEISYKSDIESRQFVTDSNKMSYKSVTKLVNDKNLDSVLNWNNFSLITSNLTPSGLILNPINTGVLRDLVSTNTIDPPTYGDMYIDVAINSSIDHRGAIVVIKDNLTKSVLGSLTHVEPGYRTYQIPFRVKSILDKIDISIYSYREAKIQYSKLDVFYPDRKTDFNVGEQLDFTSKSGTNFIVKDNQLSLSSENEKTIMSSDILNIFRENIGDKVVLDTTRKGVGFFDRRDYTISLDNFSVSSITKTWK